MEREQALSQFSVFDKMTKKDIEAYLAQVHKEIDDRDPFVVLAQVTAVGEIIDGIQKLVRDRLLISGQMDGGAVIRNGVKFELSTRKTYDYSNCPAWVELDTRKKELEKVMKTIPKEIADTETGEVIPPALWKASETVKVTLRKE